MSAFVYGYLHHLPARTASDVVRTRNRLRDIALRRRCLFVEPFVLLAVPSLTHFHPDPYVARLICQDLSGWIGNSVWVAGTPVSVGPSVQEGGSR
ncbi:hypothetical protein [Streptomyces sp. NPDC056061]|uniref:hypothetical protein n=1 Tax=Streptomyces sp. NPDC056061 TaxID=3345700 RepID=UPI0035D72D5C